MSDPTQSPIFVQRLVEAKILKHVYETLIESHGEEVAKKTIADSVRHASIAQAKEMSEGVETSMTSFIELMEMWTRGGALETAGAFRIDRPGWLLELRSNPWPRRMAAPARQVCKHTAGGTEPGLQAPWQTCRTR